MNYRNLLWIDIEELFVKHNVDMHIAAHIHVYERTLPTYNYKPYKNGVNV